MEQQCILETGKAQEEGKAESYEVQHCKLDNPARRNPSFSELSDFKCSFV